MNGRVEGLDAASQHFRGVCDGRYIPRKQSEQDEQAGGQESKNILDRKARLPDHLRSTSGSEKTNIVLDQTLCEVKEPGLVVDGDDGW